MPENRIPELDILRGFCILSMIAVHLIYDLTEIYCVFPAYPAAVLFLKNRLSATLWDTKRGRKP